MKRLVFALCVMVLYFGKYHLQAVYRFLVIDREQTSGLVMMSLFIARTWSDCSTAMAYQT